MAYTVDKNQLCVDGVALSDIADAVATPTYVYSADVMTTQYHNLENAMVRNLPADQQPLLCYACKANSNIAVLSLLRSLGSGLEIVSGGELPRGLRAGFNPKHIVMTGVGKQRQEIIDCLEAGIKQFNVESLPELEHIQNVASDIGKKATVVFRLNPNVSGGGHDKISTGRERDKFGLNLENVHNAYAMAQDMSHVEAIGLSMHIGSQVFQVLSFRKAFETLPDIVQGLRDKGYNVSSLDIGGGFPIQYNDEELLDLDAYAEWVGQIIAPLGTDIIMEPGRYLVGNAGVLLTKTLYTKHTRERDFLILDAAMNDLIRPTLYDAYHGIEKVSKDGEDEETFYDVVGPICETGDTFSKDRALPVMKTGDLVVIKEAGAYGMCMASNYNTRGLPAEVLVQDGAFHVIRKRQSVDEILDKDIVPDHLK